MATSRPTQGLRTEESLLLLTVTLLLCRSPLFGAFAYEFSLAFGAAALLVLAPATAFRLARLRRTRPLTPSDLLHAALSGMACLLPPLAAILLNSAHVSVCRYDVGLAWFLLNAGISAAFGIGSGIWAARRTLSIRRAVVLSYVPALLFSVLTIRDLLVEPPVFFLHPAFGYFAGPLYDEWIPIRFEVVSFRLWSLGMALWMAWPSRSRRWKVAGALIFTLLLLREPLGWFTSATEIEKRLGARASAPGLRLIYSPDHLSKKKADALLKDLSFRLEALSKDLHLRLPKGKSLEIFLYPSSETKRKWMGAGSTIIAHPVQGRIHTTLWSPHSTLLTHEMTHLLAAPKGIPLLGIPSRIALLEGIATAAETFRGELSLHEWARAMLELNELPPMGEMMQGLSFWKYSAGKSYLATGSFLRWMVDRRGAESFWRLYRGESFESAYGVPLQTLVDQWKAALRTIPLSSQAREIARPYFEERSIFERRCPHDVADEVEQGEKCVIRSDLGAAGRHFSRAFDFSGGDTDSALRLTRMYAKADNWESVNSWVAKVPTDTSDSEQRALATLYRGDSFAARFEGQLPPALYAGADLEKIAPGLRLVLLSRIELSERIPPLLKRILGTPSGEEWADLLLRNPPALDLPFTRLLAAQHLLDRNRPTDAHTILKGVGADPGHGLSGWRHELSAKIAEESGDRRGAFEEYAAIARESATVGKKLFAENQMARLRFLE